MRDVDVAVLDSTRTTDGRRRVPGTEPFAVRAPDAARKRLSSHRAVQ